MSRIGRFIPFVVLVGTLAAACGTSESASRDEVSTTSQGVDEMSAEPGQSPVRRELALAIQPESDVAANPLPSVEVHDVGQDRMVNFRNIFPAERPVLLWMWAPF